MPRSSKRLRLSNYWLTPIAFALHSIEEIAAFPWVWDHIPFFPVPEPLFRMASSLAVCGVAAIAFIAWKQQTHAWVWAFAWLQGLLLANVLVHVSLSIRFLGYTPGVAAACLAVAPTSVRSVLEFVRMEQIPRASLRTAVVAGAASYVPILVVLFGSAWVLLESL
jgi:hypothetical protein